jgi:hypothetical protein
MLIFLRRFAQYALICVLAALMSACPFDSNNKSAPAPAPAPDITAPTVTNKAPVDGATDVAAGTTVSGTFSEALDAATVGPGRLTVTVTGGAAVTGTVTLAGAVVTFTPDADLANATQYTATLDGKIADPSGNVLGTNSTWTFTTVTSVNMAPVFTSAAAASVSEGSTSTRYTATADDANGDTLSFSVSGGADQAQFSIDASSGVLTFVTAPSFAAPADAGADNVYDIQLTVDDGRSGTDALDVAVTVFEKSNFSLEVTYPTPNANLGGGVTQTTVTGNIVDSNDLPIDLADISFVDVNGVMATLDMANPGRWSVQVPVTAGPNTLDFELGLTSGSVVSSSQDLHNFTPFLFLSKMDLDSANNSLLTVDGFVDGLVRIDLTTGEQLLVSGNGTGAGTNFASPRDVALDTANIRVLVPDWNLDALFAVDLASGDRTVLSNGSTGTGTALDGANAVALDSANNRALVIATINNELIAVDLATGNRTVLSGVGIGAGPNFGTPRDVVVDIANNRALVSDGGLDAILAVDLDSGDRTVTSDAGTGTGPNFSNPESIVLDTANDRLLVAETGSLISVDLATGDRTELAETATDFGANGTSLRGIALDSANNRALLSDSTVDAIFAIDLTNGNRTVVSSSGTGVGADFATLSFGRGLALDSNRNRLVFSSASRLSMVVVDLSSGDRSILVDIGNTPGRVAIDADTNRAALIMGPTLSELNLDTGALTLLSANAGPGTGTDFAFPADIVVDFANNRAAVLDGGAGLLSVATDTGDRSVISDSGTGSGPMWAFADALDVDISADLGYVVDDADTAVYGVNLSTGDRVIVSDNAGIGVGPNISSPQDLQLDTAANRALMSTRGGVMAVDLTTGDRAVISGAAVGSGPSFQFPSFIALDLANNRAFIYDLGVAGVVVVELSTGERAIFSK